MELSPIFGRPAMVPSLDLSAVVERFEAGQLSADLPAMSPDEDWAVYREAEGDLRSMGSMTHEE